MAKAPAKKKNLLFRLSTLLFTLYVVFSLVQIQGEIQESRELLAQLEQQNEEQRIANKELERILSDGTQEEYIERIAREKLGFAYPEEQVLIDISGS
ncbi:MAG: cell division protein FtsL [Clostridiales bacterium]|nr:cell division protein FtsL [Clostridiales bacterium]